jgi:hypothetical protein
MNLKNFLQNAAVLTSSNFLHNAALKIKLIPDAKLHPSAACSQQFNSQHVTFLTSLGFVLFSAYPIPEEGAGTYW